MSRRSALVNVMVNAAYKAARGLSRDFGEVEQLQVSQKGPADFVSAADHRAEETLVAELRKARPRYGFLVEESGVIEGEDSSNRWVVDPLDGTTNFLHGIPHFCISIGLERDGKPFAGVIYDPIRDELFWAENGIGAFLNHQRLRVSARRKMSEAVIAFGMPLKGRVRYPEYLSVVDRIWSESGGIRRLGSAALDLAYLAAGRHDGLWHVALPPWDVLAGLAIVREAGGIVTETASGTDGGAWCNLIASNGRIHDDLTRLIGKDPTTNAT